LDFIVLVSRNHRVGDQEAGHARAADRHHLVWRGVQDHAHVPAGHDVAAEHEAEQQHETDNLEHGFPRGRGRSMAVNA